MIILNFNQLNNKNNHVLNFGEQKRTFTLKLHLKIKGRIDVNSKLTLKARLALSYHANVFRGLFADVSDTVQASKALASTHCQTFDGADRAGVANEQVWQVADRLVASHCGAMHILPNTHANLCHVSSVAVRHTLGQCDDFGNLDKASMARCHGADVARLLDDVWADGFYHLLRVGVSHCHDSHVAHLGGVSRCDMVGVALLTVLSRCERLFAAKIPPVLTILLVDRDDKPITRHILNFVCLHDQSNRILNFGAVCQGKKDSSGVIVVVNDVSLTIDGKVMDCMGLNVSISNGGYGWQMTAKIARHHLKDVNIFGGFCEAMVYINGFKWRFLVDNVADNLAFGSSSLTIKGKSRSCLLAEPFFGVRSVAVDVQRYAQQIAIDELNRDSKPSGFTLDWQMTDWLIPSYSYLDKTPIGVLTWLAETAGGFINTHPFDDVIIAKQNYPVARWELSPTLTIDNRLILDMSTERTQTPDYNGVYVSGVHAGVSMLVKRQGTSGGYRGSMITHELMTDDAVARVRGIHELSSVGNRVNINLTMPMHQDIGLLLPSDVVAVGGMVGVVRGVSINVSIGGRGEIVIRQNIEVEV